MNTTRQAKRRALFEILEGRQMMANIAWLGSTSDNWHTAANWSDATIPNHNDFAQFNRAGGSTVKLFANQEKEVNLRTLIDDTAFDLNGFDSKYMSIATGGMATSSLEVTGPGVLEAPAGGGTVSIGGTGVAASAAFDGLDDFVFGNLSVGGHPVLGAGFEVISPGSGLAEIRDSLAHGHAIIVGEDADATGDLRIKDESEVTLTTTPNPVDPMKPLGGEIRVGVQSNGSASIVGDSLVDVPNLVVGAGFALPGGDPHNLDTHGTLLVSDSEVRSGLFSVAELGRGQVRIEAGAGLFAEETVIGTIGDGSVTVTDLESFLDTNTLELARGDSSQTTLTVENKGEVYVEGLGVVGEEGAGTIIVIDAQSYLEAGRLVIANKWNSLSILSVEVGARVDVTSAGRPPLGFSSSLVVGRDGQGIFHVSDGSQVNVEDIIDLAFWLGSEAEVHVSGGSIVLAGDQVKQGFGEVSKVVELGSTFRGRIYTVGVDGGANVIVKTDSVLEGTDGVVLGGGPGTLVGVYSAGILKSAATVALDANTTLQGDSIVDAGTSVTTSGSSVIIAPGPEGGGVALLTFVTPLSDVSDGMTLAIDAVAPADNDRLHVTGAVALGGVVDLNLEFTPEPWRRDPVPTPGDWIHVLSAEGALVGDVAASAPDPETLDLPPLPSEEHHYEWKAVHDRDDSSPYDKLVKLNPAFSDQPWLGNTTRDVVLLIMQIPPPKGQGDEYETPIDTALEGDGLLENDEYLGDEGMTTVLVGGPANGTLELNSDGSFVYTPNAGFQGQDSFIYSPVAGDYDGAPTTVIITVGEGGAQYPPVAEDDWFFAYDGVPMSDNVLTNDWNEAHAAELVPGTGPAVGTLDFNADGSFTYTAPNGFGGQVTFQYIAINTSSGMESEPATVTIDVYDYEPLTLDGPAASSDAAAITAAELARIGRAAIQRWALAGVDDATLSGRLAGLEFVIADLPGNLLAGAAANRTILIDVNAAGHGWFVDATPLTDREFGRRVSRSELRAGPGSPAADDVDLLTAVMHEIGHLFNLPHPQRDSTSVMAATLPVGTRKLPTAVEAAAADYLFYLWQGRRWRAG